MHINLTASGMYALENMLRGPANRSDDLSPIFNVIANKMMEHEEQVFETGGANVGRPWKVLEPATIKSKRQRGLPFPELPLSATLRLKQSLSVRGHPDMILEITDSFMRYGTNVDYAEFHDKGTINLDERHPIMFSMREISEYYRDIQEYIFNNRLS